MRRGNMAREAIGCALIAAPFAAAGWFITQQLGIMAMLAVAGTVLVAIGAVFLGFLLLDADR